MKSKRTLDGNNRPVRILSRLLRGITSNHNGDFYFLKCFNSYTTDNKLKKHERLCNDHDHCHVGMLNEYSKTFEYSNGEKSLKVPFVIYLDLESLLRKMGSCQNNPKKSYTDRKDKHKPSGFVWYLTCSFDSTKKKHGYFRGKECIEMLCETLKELAMEVINYEEKEMIPLTDKEKEFYEKHKVCHICKKTFCTDENEKNTKNT